VKVDTGYWTAANIRPISKSTKGLGTMPNPLISMAPRPGLEPGTYGLTEQHTVKSLTRKPKICIEFFRGPAEVPHRPNLFRTSMVGTAWWLQKLEANQRSANTSTELGPNLAAGRAGQGGAG
jgi:hypothetical protein